MERWTMGALCAAVACAAQPPSEERILRGWLDRVRSEHPQARVVASRGDAERADAGGSRAWMAPQVEFDLQSDGLADAKFTQMIPWPGKTAAMEGAAKAKVEMARADSAGAWQDLERQVREAAWMEWMERERARVLRDQERVVRALAEASRRNLSEGMASASDAWILLARAEQVAAEADRAEASARSARAMRRSWTGPVDDSLVPDPPRAPAWDDSVLVRRSRERPDVESMRREARMRGAMGRAAASGLKPDLMAGAMVMRMANGMPGWGLMAGFTVPFAPWADGMAVGGSRAEQARERDAQGRAEAMARMAAGEVADHSSRARGAWSAWKRLDSLVLPGQERALEQVRVRYAQGREMLAMVLSMEEMVRMSRMEGIMRRGEYELEKVRLAASAGRRIEDLEVRP